MQRSSSSWKISSLVPVLLIAAGCATEVVLEGSGVRKETTPRPDSFHAKCGNGILEPGEECDDGARASGDSCASDCTFPCVAGDPQRDACDDKNPCNGLERCDADHLCRASDPPSDGFACGSEGRCVRGACVPPKCGDGVRQSAEACDDGNADPNDGCRPDCTFTCVDACDDGDACNGAETCAANHVCVSGAPLADESPCASGYCASGACVAAACGNGKKEPGETCDDGNTNDADGCTTACAYTCDDPVDCADANPCTLDACAAATHTCENAPDPELNGAACTVDGAPGVCDAGICRPETPNAH